MRQYLSFSPKLIVCLLPYSNKILEINFKYITIYLSVDIKQSY